MNKEKSRFDPRPAFEGVDKIVILFNLPIFLFPLVILVLELLNPNAQSPESASLPTLSWSVFLIPWVPIVLISFELMRRSSEKNFPKHFKVFSFVSIIFAAFIFLVVSVPVLGEALL